jgi:hypothetical protein
MNPKAPANLDPKLKETYERVMGTSFAPTAAPTQPRPVQTTVVQEPESATLPQPAIPAQLLPIDVANPAGPEMVQSPQMPTTGDPFKTAEVPPANVMMKGTTAKKKNFLMPVLLMVGGLIFFIAYAVIWAKVFGLF